MFVLESISAAACIPDELVNFLRDLFYNSHVSISDCVLEQKSRLCKMTWYSGTYPSNLAIHLQEHALICTVNAGLKPTE